MATHIVECSSPELLPFARSRIKAIRATGLQYASQTFDCGIGKVHVRVVGEHDYISVTGGDGYRLWVQITHTSTVTDYSGRSGSGGNHDSAERTKRKTWILTSRDGGNPSIQYTGETDIEVVDTLRTTYNAGDFLDHISGSSSSTLLTSVIKKGIVGSLAEPSISVSNVAACKNKLFLYAKLSSANSSGLGSSSINGPYGGSWQEITVGSGVSGTSDTELFAIGSRVLTNTYRSDTASSSQVTSPLGGPGDHSTSSTTTTGSAWSYLNLPLRSTGHSYIKLGGIVSREGSDPGCPTALESIKTEADIVAWDAVETPPGKPRDMRGYAPFPHTDVSGMWWYDDPEILPSPHEITWEKDEPKGMDSLPGITWHAGDLKYYHRPVSTESLKTFWLVEYRAYHPHGDAAPAPIKAIDLRETGSIPDDLKDLLDAEYIAYSTGDPGNGENMIVGTSGDCIYARKTVWVGSSTGFDEWGSATVVRHEQKDSLHISYFTSK